MPYPLIPRASRHCQRWPVLRRFNHVGEPQEVEPLHVRRPIGRIDADRRDAFFSQGNAREAKGDLEGALLDYNEEIRLKPDDV